MPKLTGRDWARIRWNTLGMQIVAHKIMYYHPEKVHESWEEELIITDEAYDAKEVEFLKLCRLLDYSNIIVHKSYPGLETKGDGMMEVDFKTYIARMVLGRVEAPRDEKE